MIWLRLDPGGREIAGCGRKGEEEEGGGRGKRGRRKREREERGGRMGW